MQSFTNRQNSFLRLPTLPLSFPSPPVVLVGGEILANNYNGEYVGDIGTAPGSENWNILIISFSFYRITQSFIILLMPVKMERRTG
jgi:hypothetical protein